MNAAPQSPRSGGPFGSRPSLPPIKITAKRIAIGVVILGIIVLLLSARGIAGLYTDFLWFDQLGFASIWRGVIGRKIALAVGFTAIAFVFLLLNIVIADRVQPAATAANIEDLLLARYRQIVGQRVWLVRMVAAFIFALFIGPNMSTRWDEWLLFSNSQDFGINDPQFSRDIGFYVFRLPFLSGVVSWGFSLALLAVFVTAVAHYVNGGIKVQPVPRITNAVKVHLSVLLACVAGARALSYWLQTYTLTYTGSGVVDGPGYTDIHARLPALRLLIVISLASVVLFLVNIRQRGWAMPVLAVALWGVVSIVVGEVFPRVVQVWRVRPNEAQREAQSIERNIAATRAAFGIDKIETKPFPYETALTAADLAKNGATIRNIRVWDPDKAIAQKTFQQLQSVRTYFRFNDVDIDRYVLNGALTQVLIAVRDLAPDSTESRSWVNRHLTYTHGYGVVIAPTNASASGGQPAFVVKDLPPAGEPKVTQPRVYFGENLSGFAIVGAKQDETDFPSNDGKTTQKSRYEGKGGVTLKSLPRRLAFALRFGDPNLVISSAISSNSKILYTRDVRERARKAAPFLRFDGDPYPVIENGRVVWVLDAYTTTHRYPYSQTARNDVLDPELPSGLHAPHNYVRNSVKTVIDAYDGTVRFFVVDDTDPIARAYQSAFPKLLLPGAELDKLYPGLRPHLRYPEDLFRIQSGMYGRYHIDQADDFYGKSDAWDISPDPGTGVILSAAQRQAQADQTAQAARQGIVLVSESERPMAPYYLMMKLPGETKEGFILLQNFVPLADVGRPKPFTQTAFMVAKSDPGEYGKLVVYELPRDRQIKGPALIGATINQDTTVSQQETLLSQGGSEVLLGSLQVIPIEKSLVYIRPLYVQSEDKSSQVPELKAVIVVQNERVAIAPTLNGALQQLFGEGAVPGAVGATPPVTKPGEPTTGGSTTGSTVPSGATDVASLLARAATAYDDAQAALKKGDLAQYQTKVDEVGRLIDQAMGNRGSVTTSTTIPPAPSTPPAFVPSVVSTTVVSATTSASSASARAVSVTTSTIAA